MKQEHKAKLKRRPLPLHTIPEVARYLGRCDRTVRRLIRAGKLHVIPWGISSMVTEQELDRVLREGF